MTALASFIVAFAFSFAFAQKAEAPPAPPNPPYESDTVPHNISCQFSARDCFKRQKI